MMKTQRAAFDAAIANETARVRMILNYLESHNDKEPRSCEQMDANLPIPLASVRPLVSALLKRNILVHMDDNGLSPFNNKTARYKINIDTSTWKAKRHGKDRHKA